MITVPDSVLAYMKEADTSSAIDLLLAGKQPRVPVSLEWPHVGNFYRACLAAWQTATEFALFLEELWDAVWADVPRGWKEGDPGRPARADLSVDIFTIWAEKCFTRRFERSGHALELSISLTPRAGVQLGFALWDKKERDLIATDPPRDWDSEDGADDFYWTQKPITALQPEISPEPFASWVKQVHETVQARMAKAVTA